MGVWCLGRGSGPGAARSVVQDDLLGANDPPHGVPLLLEVIRNSGARQRQRISPVPAIFRAGRASPATLLIDAVRRAHVLREWAPSARTRAGLGALDALLGQRRHVGQLAGQALGGGDAQHLTRSRASAPSSCG